MPKLSMSLMPSAIAKKSLCLICKKNKDIIIVAQYNHDIDDLSIEAYCKECFRKEFPEYKLEADCLICKHNFNCNIQNLLFSKKEIKVFKKKYWIIGVNNHEN